MNNKYFVLLILALIWGTSFILIKKSVEVFTPYQVGGLRVSLAGLALLAFGIPALKRWNKKTIMWAALSGFLGNFVPMFLFPLAEMKVSSSLAGILNSIVPIFTLLFGYLFFNAKSTKLQIIGAIIGFAGANFLMYFSGSEQGESNFYYALLIVLATIMYSLSGLIVKSKLQDVKSMELGGMVFGIWFLPALVILILSGFFGDFENDITHWKGLGYVAILGLMSTAAAMILFYRLIQQTTAVFASSVTYLMPIIAVIWGILDGEEFTMKSLIGAGMILVGIYLIRERKTVTKT